VSHSRVAAPNKVAWPRQPQVDAPSRRTYGADRAPSGGMLTDPVMKSGAADLTGHIPLHPLA
jgi:hypothetical protein